jgi:hypothetical protein
MRDARSSKDSSIVKQLRRRGPPRAMASPGATKPRVSQNPFHDLNILDAGDDPHRACFRWPQQKGRRSFVATRLLFAELSVDLKDCKIVMH